MGPGGHSNSIDQVIGQLPPNLQSVPGGGPPGLPPPGGFLPGQEAAASVHSDDPLTRGAMAPNPLPYAPWIEPLTMRLPAPFAAGNPFARLPPRY